MDNPDGLQVVGEVLDNTTDLDITPDDLETQVNGVIDNNIGVETVGESITAIGDGTGTETGTGGEGTGTGEGTGDGPGTTPDTTTSTDFSNPSVPVTPEDLAAQIIRTLNLGQAPGVAPATMQQMPGMFGVDPRKFIPGLGLGQSILGG